MRNLIIIVIAGLMFSGCASTAITHEKFQNADYGSYPKNYEEIISKYFQARLKDPFSAKYKYKLMPDEAYVRNAPILGGGITNFGYVVYVNVNAKNSFGGYTGWEEFRLLIRNGRVIDRITPNQFFSEPWYQ